MLIKNKIPKTIDLFVYRRRTHSVKFTSWAAIIMLILKNKHIMCNIVCYFLQRVSRSCADAKQLVFVFCKIKKSSVFLGITLSTSPTDLPFTFTHTHTHTNSSYSNLHSHSHPTRDNIRFPNATRARFTDDDDECGTRICEPWSTWLTLAWSWWYPTPKWGHDNYISYILTLAWKLLTHDELSFVKAADLP